MKTNLSNNLSELTEAVQDYMKVRMNLIKLSILEKMTKIYVLIISGLVFILLGTVFFIFSAAAFVVWYGGQYGDYLTGLLIVVGILFLFGLLFFFARDRVITSSIIKNLSSILFEEDEDGQ